MAALQIKPLAVALFAERLPDFALFAKKSPGYWFRRTRQGMTDILVCTTSLKYQSVEIDLYCGVFEDWGGGYGTHLLSSGARLDNLRYGTSALDVNLIGYRHDQTRDSVVAALRSALDDIERFALPYFETFREHVRRHVLVRAAFQWIEERRALLPMSIQQDIREELSREGLYRMTNPYFLELQSHLRNIEGISRAERKEVTILVLDIFRWFSEGGKKWDLIS